MAFRFQAVTVVTSYVSYLSAGKAIKFSRPLCRWCELVVANGRMEIIVTARHVKGKKGAEVVGI
jgi:hypothetical protein